MMPENLESTYRPLLEAVAFAARAHRPQLRKDGQTPYVSHVFRVTLVLRDVFGISDRRTLTAAVLHDTLEDTNTDFDDLQETFGTEVAGWVAALSKDKRLAHDPREEAYGRTLADAPWQVQVCKLADIFDNLIDTVHLRREQRERTLTNSRRYLDTLRSKLQEQAAEAWKIVDKLYRELASGGG
jgi:guanosine-3',5'-bis(diphosphate) 3'-pyrophosphohydrolase